MDHSLPNNRKSFDFRAFRDEESLCIPSRVQMAISLHHIQCSILALTSRECVRVALQFNGDHYLSSSVN